jgi:multiple sugar transport system ATP-binding protein
LADRVVVMSKAEVQQIGTPEQIYNDPANLFVASFIGNPSMNLIKGSLRDGVFEAEGVRVAGFGQMSQADVVMGVRAEDLQISTSPVNASLQGRIFSFELTGDATLATIHCGSQKITARGNKELRADIGSTQGFQTDAQRCYLFDAHSQNRLRVGS